MPRKACECLAIDLCELIIDDIHSRNKSLIHMFTRIVAPALPVRFYRFCVYVALTDGRGEQEARLEIVRPSQTPLLEMRGAVKFPDPTQVVELVFEFHDLIFPEEGKYAVNCYVGDSAIISRPFHLSLAKPARANSDEPPAPSATGDDRGA